MNWEKAFREHPEWAKTLGWPKDKQRVYSMLGRIMKRKDEFDRKTMPRLKNGG